MSQNEKDKGEIKTPPAQHQNHQPGIEAEMSPKPLDKSKAYQGIGKLADKTAIITGGDSGIGRSVAIAFAKEGANVVIVYLEEHGDAIQTVKEIEKTGRAGIAIAGDLGDENFCQHVIEKSLMKFNKLDILVNNAGEQHPQDDFMNIDAVQLERTFRTNIFSYFYMTRACLPHLQEGAAIINTTSVTAYKGSGHLIDYSSTKGAIVAFTRSLALALVEKGIRVNGVAPGPVWTPLIPASFSKGEVARFGQQVPMKRMGQPDEIAPSFVFLAAEDSSYMTGQILHPNGGVIVNG